MNVAQYTFQSPSSSQVQVGKLDPSSVEQEKPKETEKNTEPVSTSVPKAPEEFLVKGTTLLDIYA